MSCWPSEASVSFNLLKKWTTYAKPHIIVPITFKTALLYNSMEPKSRSPNSRCSAWHIHSFISSFTSEIVTRLQSSPCSHTPMPCLQADCADIPLIYRAEDTLWSAVQVTLLSRQEIMETWRKAGSRATDASLFVHPIYSTMEISAPSLSSSKIS